MSYRIVKEGNKFFPQYLGWITWQNILENKLYLFERSAWRNTIEDAKLVIECHKQQKKQEKEKHLQKIVWTEEE